MRPVLDEVTYKEAAEFAYNGAKVLHPRTLAPLIEKGFRSGVRTASIWRSGTRIVTRTPRYRRAPCGHVDGERRAGIVDAAKAAVNGTAIMGRALDALAGADSEVLAFSSSSYRQNFCFLIRKEELAAALDGARIRIRTGTRA